jgi:hypothetical protein
MKKGDCSQHQLATPSWPPQGRTTFYWLILIPSSIFLDARTKRIRTKSPTHKTLAEKVAQTFTRSTTATQNPTQGTSKTANPFSVSSKPTMASQVDNFYQNELNFLTITIAFLYFKPDVLRMSQKTRHF